MPEVRLDDNFLQIMIVLASVSVACIVIQRLFKKDLERDQYYYLRDISLMAGWAICGIWTTSASMKLTITAGVVAMLVGFCQKVAKSWDLRFCYLVIGLGLSLLGPRISFLGLATGEFFYLSTFSSIALSTLWVGFFPILFQELDEIPGMGGALLVTSWTLLAVVTLLSSRGITDALVMSICGLLLIIVFWSRHINAYRRLGLPLSALWGTLVAGASMLGASKGVAFSTVMILPLALFALPIVETSVSVLSAAFLPKPMGNMILYRKLVNRGIDHPRAVYSVAAVCGAIGSAIAVVQLGYIDLKTLVLCSLFIGCGTLIAVRAKFINDGEASKRRPALWGVTVDNVSLDYALGRVHGWIESQLAGPQIIVTPDATSALRSRTDKRYRSIVARAGLSLPDGMGLFWALRLLGTPVQSRIPGVEFMEHLCRQAAGQGWPVYLLGGKPGIADKAASRLKAKFAGLQIAGCRNGYFDSSQEDEICDEIRSSEAKLLFVGFGVPRQEYWLGAKLDSIGNIVGMGVGGSMDVISGTLKRAPAGWQKAGLEWLYRLIQEPWRWKRVMNLPLFVFLVLLTKLKLDPWNPNK